MKKDVKKVVSNEVTNTNKRVSTKDLLSSKKAEDIISGVARVLCDCVAERSQEKKQVLVNKISKSTIALRNGKVNEEGISKAKELINKSWANIKECKADNSKKLSKDSNELYDLLLSFNKKDSVADLPDEIKF